MADSIGLSQKAPDYGDLSSASAGGIGGGGGIPTELFGQLLNALGIPTMAARGARQNAAYQSVQHDLALGIEPSKDKISLLPDDFQKIVMQAVKGEEFQQSRQHREESIRKADALEELTKGMSPEIYQRIQQFSNMTPTDAYRDSTVPQFAGFNPVGGRANTPVEQLVVQSTLPASLLAAGGRPPTEVEAALRQQEMGAANLRTGVQASLTREQLRSEEKRSQAQIGATDRATQANLAAIAQRREEAHMSLAANLAQTIIPYSENAEGFGTIYNVVHDAIVKKGHLDTETLKKVTAMRPLPGGRGEGVEDKLIEQRAQQLGAVMKGYHSAVQDLSGKKEVWKKNPQYAINEGVRLGNEYLTAAVEEAFYRNGRRAMTPEQALALAETALVFPNVSPDGIFSGGELSGVVPLGELRQTNPQLYQQIRNQLEISLMTTYTLLGVPFTQTPPAQPAAQSSATQPTTQPTARQTQMTAPTILSTPSPTQTRAPSVPPGTAASPPRRSPTSAPQQTGRGPQRSRSDVPPALVPSPARRW